MKREQLMQKTPVRPAFLSFLMLAVFTCAPALAQEYLVELEVTDGQLKIVSTENCAGERLHNDVCVGAGQSAEIQFYLVRGSEDWEISQLLIRDPALNWLDELPEQVAANYGQFSPNGVFMGSLDRDGKLTITNGNRHALAVQYRITARHKESGQETAPAFSVIETSGGEPRTGN